jgi:miniconductance mechanosensitive channel
MENTILYLTEQLIGRGVPVDQAELAARAMGLVALLFLAWAANFLAKRVIVRAVTAVVRRTNVQWDDALVDAGVFTRLSHLVPALVIRAFGNGVLGDSPAAERWLENFVTIYLLVIVLGVFSAVLDAGRKILEQSKVGVRMPLKGFVQAVKLAGVVIVGIFILSVVFGKTPVYFLSSLGALTAVMLLIFKDAILGFVAGIQISVNQLVQVGDWIEVPKAGADGDVIDVSLTTVKVRNWDKTITTVPTYSLISDSFINWRGMQESGGRRIKRALYLDMQTVRFADEAMLARWRKIDLLRPYLEEKAAELAADAATITTDAGVPGNRRSLTNLGTFRAYIAAYLHAHPKINQEMTFLVRHLDPTERGLPIEIYVFSADKVWANYEAIQADIFDHLLAMVPEFDLRIFQSPGGYDLQKLGALLPGRKE